MLNDLIFIKILIVALLYIYENHDKNQSFMCPLASVSVKVLTVISNKNTTLWVTLIKLIIC